MQNQDVVQLQIGYHVLEGKRMPLKKPMAIMDKVQEIDFEGNSQTVCKVCGPTRKALAVGCDTCILNHQEESLFQQRTVGAG